MVIHQNHTEPCRPASDPPCGGRLAVSPCRHQSSFAVPTSDQVSSGLQAVAEVDSSTVRVVEHRNEASLVVARLHPIETLSDLLEGARLNAGLEGAFLDEIQHRRKVLGGAGHRAVDLTSRTTSSWTLNVTVGLASPT